MRGRTASRFQETEPLPNPSGAHAVSLYLLRARILRRFRFSRRMRFFFHFPRICRVGEQERMDKEAGDR